MLAFAHRGGATHPEIVGLENTLAAFQHAYDLGYRYFETDVHASIDGVLFAFHDDELDRVTDGSGRLAELPSGTIGQARVGGRHAIPTLAELVDAFPDVTFNVDIKADDATGPLADLVTRRQLSGRVIVGSFSSARLRRFRRLTAGQVPTSADPREVAAFVLCPSPLVARLLRALPCVALQVPVHTSIRGRRVEVVTRRFVRNAHAAGKHVHVWTIDEPTEMERLIALGVDGIMTDRTDLLKDVLITHGLWRTN
ncbi:glycerophosphoryl diester phosphodiesterase [Nocardioides baekrokdamisoli]|uniref:Glycerophosphoryl diester phosphodiesterase n=1 Tax=Nocardioides baekrokdamisoli TaxID=1804624 RepID=A0A3G9ICC9_9ACTN|nr:glycerophosphodiester phosphodiesterase [Nocardioides baekrokdamisoli]BBH16012.1 glycerophosphoryl diester phosphodiesterase [Nocardioides baekrokdamisoli]